MAERRHLTGIAPQLAAVVQDWGGFERLVAEIHADNDVQVTVGEEFPGRSGTWKVDVAIRYKQGLHRYLTIAECKYWTSPVGRLHISNLVACRSEIKADKAVIFTTIGFETGAESFAKDNGVEVYVVREPTDAEWGYPGRNVLLFLEAATVSVPRLELTVSAGTHLPQPLDAPNLWILNSKGERRRTLQDIIQGMAAQCHKLIANYDFFLDGNSRAFARVGPYRSRFEGQAFIDVPGRPSVIGVSCDYLFEITRDRLEIDRLDNFRYALAVENKVTGHTATVSQRPGQGRTLHEHTGGPVDRTGVVENGSRVSFLCSGFEDESAMEERAQGERLFTFDVETEDDRE